MYEIPTPEELRSFMVSNNLTGADVSALTGVDPRTARRWIAYKNHRPIPWASWTLLLLFTKNTTEEKLLELISQWKAEKTKSSRPLFAKPRKTLKDT
jgi:hypothetical protein